MAIFRDDFRQCNSCGSMNNSKLSKCHSCGNSLRGFKTDIIASVVKKQIVTDQTKGSQKNNKKLLITSRYVTGKANKMNRRKVITKQNIIYN